MAKRVGVNDVLDRGLLRDIARAGDDLEVIDTSMTEWSNLGMVIKEIRIKGPEETRDGYLAIIKAVNEARTPFVAFRSAGTLKDLNRKIAGDIEEGRLQFREEQPYDPDGAKARAKKA